MKGYYDGVQYASKPQRHSDTVRHLCKFYARRFAPVAMAEMGRYGVPASITVAQAILHSNAGDDAIAIKNNNHFGIQCFSKECPKGHCSHHGCVGCKSAS